MIVETASLTAESKFMFIFYCISTNFFSPFWRISSKASIDEELGDKMDCDKKDIVPASKGASTKNKTDI